MSTSFRTNEALSTDKPCPPHTSFKSYLKRAATGTNRKKKLSDRSIDGKEIDNRIQVNDDSIVTDFNYKDKSVRGLKDSLG